MTLRIERMLFALCFVILLLASTIPLHAQSEVKAKPPMYTYVSIWAIPRSHWDEMPKAVAADEPILQKAIASGAITGYGNDSVVVHQGDGYTHDDWWSSMSMAGLMNTLEAFYSAGNATISVYDSATKHADEVFVSRFYNWKAGSWKGVYGHGSQYTLKATAPDDAVDVLARNLFVPFMEKLLADGTIYEYEVDTEAIHTDNPNNFFLYYVCANTECLDKVNNGLQSWMKDHPLDGPTIGSMVDFTNHRDELLRGNATFK